jgi:hypothetical protein
MVLNEALGNILGPTFYGFKSSLWKFHALTHSHTFSNLDAVSRQTCNFKDDQQWDDGDTWDATLPNTSQKGSKGYLHKLLVVLSRTSAGIKVLVLSKWQQQLHSYFWYILALDTKWFMYSFFLDMEKNGVYLKGNYLYMRIMTEHTSI